MAEPKWTPGPWAVAALDRRCVVEADNDSVIADVRDWRNPANAHLISACPDLYEALKLSTTLIERLAHRLDEESGNQMEVSLLLYRVKTNGTALAKARGETK